MAAITSGGSTTGHLADTVEAAIDAEDIVPLVSQLSQEIISGSLGRLRLCKSWLENI